MLHHDTVKITSLIYRKLFCTSRKPAIYVYIFSIFVKNVSWYMDYLKLNQPLNFRNLCQNVKNTHREKLCLIQFSTRMTVDSNLFDMFTQSIKFYCKFHYHLLSKTADVRKM